MKRNSGLSAREKAGWLDIRFRGDKGRSLRLSLKTYSGPGEVRKITVLVFSGAESVFKGKGVDSPKLDLEYGDSQDARKR